MSPPTGGCYPRRAPFPIIAAQGLLNCFAVSLLYANQPRFVSDVFGGFFNTLIYIWVLPVMAGTASAALYTWSLPRYKIKDA